MRAERTILQIIPATDWYAFYLDEQQEQLTCALVAWALVEDPDTGQREVIGLDTFDGCVEPCTMTNTFAEYRHVSELPKPDADRRHT